MVFVTDFASLITLLYQKPVLRHEFVYELAYFTDSLYLDL
jgi:hypothetical protein